jgi:hypothetical protein
MNKYLSILIGFLLFGCSQIKENTDLFGIYGNYIKSAKETEVVFNMLTSELRVKINNLGSDQFPIITSFPTVISNSKNHYQVIDKAKGCLTINGFDKSNSPVSLYIEYTNENNKWLLSFVEIYYLESPHDFVHTGVCPTRLE